MNAVAERPKARAAKRPSPGKAPAPSLVQHLPIVRELAELLERAYRNGDDALMRTGYSDRLLRLAATLAENTANQLKDDSLSDDDGFEDCCYNLAALVNAAQHIPGDQAGPVRLALIQQVGGLIISLTKDTAIMNDGGHLPPSDQQTFACDAWNQVCEVEAVLRFVLQSRPEKTFVTNGLWGVMSIIGTAANELERFHEQPSHDECFYTLQSLEQASGLIYVVGCCEEDPIWDACIRLLSMAENALKAGMERMGHG